MLDSNRSLSSLQMAMFKDTNTEIESTDGQMRGRRKNKLEVEGLFRESDSSEEGETKQKRRMSKARSVNKRKKSKVASNKKKQIEQENESLKKAMAMMQEKYNEILNKSQAGSTTQADPTPRESEKLSQEDK